MINLVLSQRRPSLIPMQHTPTDLPLIIGDKQMKPRKFYDTMMPIFLVFEIFGLCGLALLISIVVAFICFAPPEYITLKAQFYLIGILLPIGGGFYGLFNHAFYDRAFGRLLVYENKVVYKCLLRKTLTMKKEEIKYAGVEDFHLLNKGVLRFRGDEDAFVYLSTTPFPDEYRGKVTLLKNKTGFIKFTYSDNLAETLIDILPAETDNLIRAFYGRMKSQDVFSKQKKRSNKKK